ncbi:MAG: glucuronate isomerase [Flavobacteriaceae bacterium]|nr:glucuronate isomerase [Flavobacteriaceae bacterium]
MMKFLDDNFLLQTKTAQRLYHNYAKDLPIIDYHNHLSPKDISEDKQFKNLTEIWLEGDHYKWRAMRANGIDEAFITGNKSDKEKFEKWAETVPYAMRNPLYHWTHIELQRYFNIDELLNEKSANKIYEDCSKALNAKEYSVQSLLSKMNVEVLCTTDDPTDDLKYHKQFKESNHLTKMLPTFRPDNAILIENENYLNYLSKLEKTSNSKIKSFTDLVLVLEKRVQYFNGLGCKVADCGLSSIPFIEKVQDPSKIFNKRLSNKPLTASEINNFQVALLMELSIIYFENNWVLQLHLGAIRNNNEHLLSKIGADVGCDSIGDYEQAKGLSQFLNNLSIKNCLPKIILYNLNPKDNEVFATMAGNFTSNGGVNKIQFGAAWWFLDQKDGIEKQLNTISNMGLLSRFVGMLTDSRSFLSFPRHEYFRRTLCNLLGNDVEKGELPNDIELLGKMVQDICYYNAKNYFQFD